MKNKTNRKKYFFVVPVLMILVIAGIFALTRSKVNTFPLEIKPDDKEFLAPGKNFASPKKVEDYFISDLHMTEQQAKDARSSSLGNDGKITLRLREQTTLDGLLSNLQYYGFIRDTKALKYALEHTTDTVPGHAKAIMIGSNTIDIWASYRISENMSAWEIADQLLNHPTYFSYDQYGYMFMP